MNARIVNPMLVAAVTLSACLAFGCGSAGAPRTTAEREHAMPRVVVSDSGSDFALSPGEQRFVVWGVNYDHDEAGRLIEDYWDAEWGKVEEDFGEMRALGANVVRVHLQFGKFMTGPDTPNDAALARLRELVALAERTGLYLDLTGLGCYHKADVQPWYDAMDERQRWDAQAVFWSAVAKACDASPAVFCYDLMNEPVIPGDKRPDGEWLAKPLGDKHFVQWLTLDPAGRDRTTIARQWLDRMIGAIRAHDRQTMITVGLFVFSGFDPKEACGDLDFLAVHEYPQAGKVDQAVRFVKRYDVGKPLIVEEMFPLRCGVEDLDRFVQQTRPFTDGYVGFYWGGLGKGDDPKTEIARAITKSWLDYFRAQAPRMKDAGGG